jgi:hypothetical protein
VRVLLNRGWLCLFCWYPNIYVCSDVDPIGEVCIDLVSLNLRQRAMTNQDPLDIDIKLDKVPHGSIQVSLELQIFS